MKPRTDKPKPAPFKVGQKLRYKGDSHAWEIIDGKEIPSIAPGMIVTIVENKYGRQGSGMLLETDDLTGESYYDETSDWISVYENEFGRRRLIHRENKKDWEVL